MIEEKLSNRCTFVFGKPTSLEMGLVMPGYIQQKEI
jgi:hypothetical protein